MALWHNQNQPDATTQGGTLGWNDVLTYHEELFGETCLKSLITLAIPFGDSSDREMNRSYPM